MVFAQCLGWFFEAEFLVVGTTIAPIPT